MMRAGGSAAGLTYDKGKVRAIPTQYDDLADTVEPALDKAITAINQRLQKLDENDRAVLALEDGFLVQQARKAFANGADQ
ncbi:MAG: hypothetical protein KUG74_00130, partial [Rhodobacteraceae bacterium]|nr:hypothetical protein [Paracoccaceae bacterium]